MIVFFSSHKTISTHILVISRTCQHAVTVTASLLSSAKISSFCARAHGSRHKAWLGRSQANAKAVLCVLCVLCVVGLFSGTATVRAPCRGGPAGVLRSRVPRWPGRLGDTRSQVEPTPQVWRQFGSKLFRKKISSESSFSEIENLLSIKK
jgi:hypothetical protein